MSRISDDWLETFKAWTMPRSEAPESFITWAGLFTLASVLKRKVIFPERLLGSYEIATNLYIIFVGPPGIVRKSTTTGYPEKLLKKVDGVTLAPDDVSKSKLIEVFADLTEEGVDSAVTVLSAEFGSFVSTSQDEMYTFLTDMYDGKGQYRYWTRAHDKEDADRPCLNLLAATVPEWIDTQPPEHITGGGFSSRVIFIYEDKRRRDQMYYDKIVDWDEIHRLGNLVSNDLDHIAMHLEGEFNHDCDETKDAMEDWYQRVASKERGDERVQGYFNRKHVHAHKVAMLLSAGRRDDLLITMKDFEDALKILKIAETKMPQALASVGRNPISKYMIEIEDFIKYQNGRVSLPRILARFNHNLRPDETKEILSTLTIIGHIKRFTEEGNIEYSVL